VKQDCFKGFEPEPKPEKNGKKEKVVQEWDVPSWTDSTMRYKVRREGSKWTCTCYFFTERIQKSEKPNRDCKHIQFKKEELGIIKEDLSGYKSAIQKALRRGSLPLLKISFSKLWEMEPKWLLWRLPILAAEETWAYTGYAGPIAFDQNPQREDVWKLLANIALHPKNKEAEGIRILADKCILHKEDPKKLIRNVERLNVFYGWMEVKKRIETIETDKEGFWTWWNGWLRPENDFAAEILRTCKRRVYFGGMSGDKELLLTVAYFACVMKVDPFELEEVPAEEEVEALPDIPWYCWDMHTSIGKIAYYQIKKMFQDESMGEYVGMELWFNLGSAWCDSLVEDSYWWELCLKAWAKRRKKTLDQCRVDYERWIPKIRERVERILAARRRNGQKLPKQ
jgi:hypothetical protein